MINLQIDSKKYIQCFKFMLSFWLCPLATWCTIIAKAPSTRAIFMWQLYVAIFVCPCRWLDKELLLICASNNFAQRRWPWKGKKQDGKSQKTVQLASCKLIGCYVFTGCAAKFSLLRLPCNTAVLTRTMKFITQLWNSLCQASLPRKFLHTLKLQWPYIYRFQMDEMQLCRTVRGSFDKNLQALFFAAPQYESLFSTKIQWKAVCGMILPVTVKVYRRTQYCQ